MSGKSRAASLEELEAHRLDRLLHPKVYIHPPIGTLVCVPDGGAPAVVGRVVRYDQEQCVVAKLGAAAYEIWAYVEASDLVKEH